jgi:YgiT-type zinc finger domain-containing protein
MKKICNFCGNKNFREKHVQYIYRHDSQFLVVNNVPCEECEYCGEQYFKAEVLKKIEKDFTAIYRAKKKAKRVVKLPVEEFIEI